MALYLALKHGFKNWTLDLFLQASCFWLGGAAALRKWGCKNSIFLVKDLAHVSRYLFQLVTVYFID